MFYQGQQNGTDLLEHRMTEVDGVLAAVPRHRMCRALKADNYATQRGVRMGYACLTCRVVTDITVFDFLCNQPMIAIEIDSIVFKVGVTILNESGCNLC